MASVNSCDASICILRSFSHIETLAFDIEKIVARAGQGERKAARRIALHCKKRGICASRCGPHTHAGARHGSVVVVHYPPVQRVDIGRAQREGPQ